MDAAAQTSDTAPRRRRRPTSSVQSRGQNGQTNQEETSEQSVSDRHHASIHVFASSTSVQPLHRLRNCLISGKDTSALRSKTQAYFHILLNTLDFIQFMFCIYHVIIVVY